MGKLSGGRGSNPGLKKEYSDEIVGLKQNVIRS